MEHDKVPLSKKKTKITMEANSSQFILKNIYLFFLAGPGLSWGMCDL